MLSKNIQAVADKLRPYAETGMELDATAVGAICAVLDAAADDARELENRPMSLLDQVPEGGRNNVVKFPGGGDAA
ncbi:MAG: hypothetical protein HQL35_04800 [Alphaproteobacteria bacterium]|nr:hypothetical protein [Alphaproteobacteria bacterium]